MLLNFFGVIKASYSYLKDYSQRLLTELNNLLDLIRYYCLFN